MRARAGIVGVKRCLRFGAFLPMKTERKEGQGGERKETEKRKKPPKEEEEREDRGDGRIVRSEGKTQLILCLSLFHSLSLPLCLSFSRGLSLSVGTALAGAVNDDAPAR